MEKSFNDQELADIMSEIENLEKEFTTEAKPQSQAPVANVETEENEVLEELVSKEMEDVIPKTHSNIIALKNSEHKSTSSKSTCGTTGSGSAVSFKVEGDLKINVDFQIGSETVSIAVGSEGLVINMQGGATFTLPVTSVAKKSKKTA